MSYPTDMSAIASGGKSYLYFVDAKDQGQIKWYNTKDLNEFRGANYEGPEYLEMLDANNPQAKVVHPHASTDNTRFVAVAYNDGSRNQIRMYFRDSNFLLRELCWSDGQNDGYWYEGALSNEKFPLEATGGLDAICSDTTKQLKVYCVKQNESMPTIWYSQWEGPEPGLWHKRYIKT